MTAASIGAPTSAQSRKAVTGHIRPVTGSPLA
jgi:hypothetical protein